MGREHGSSGGCAAFVLAAMPRRIPDYVARTIRGVSGARVDAYCPFEICPLSLAEGNAFTFQPPPNALISKTLADMRRRRMSTASLWFANAVLCAVRTSR